MLYVLICDDRADSEGLRKATRDQHLQYIKAFDVRFAGPMLCADESTMVGSIIVLDTDDHATAQAFADSDPYALAGLFANVRIQPFRQVVPA